MSEVKTITIIKPDDWHLHLHDEDSGILGAVAPITAKVYGRALVEQNIAVSNKLLINISFGR